jgi:tRNA G37 N-methylase Trm5
MFVTSVLLQTLDESGKPLTLAIKHVECVKSYAPRIYHMVRVACGAFRAFRDVGHI